MAAKGSPQAVVFDHPVGGVPIQASLHASKLIGETAKTFKFMVFLKENP